MTDIEGWQEVRHLGWKMHDTVLEDWKMYDTVYCRVAKCPTLPSLRFGNFSTLLYVRINLELKCLSLSLALD